MSDRREQRSEPEVHVDTPEQAAARQLIETNQRVTYVHIEPPPLEEPPPQEEDLSLAALVHKPKHTTVRERFAAARGKE